MKAALKPTTRPAPPRAFTLIELPAMSRSTSLTAEQRGFTLIELLVVVTIIVVLLALLTPALDKAIYQAELAVDGANLKGVALGIGTYAAGNNRLYPHRPTTANPPGTAHQGQYVFNLVHPDPAQGAGRDDRPYLRGYISLKSLVDPLSGKIDLESPPNSGGQWVLCNYALWYGVQFSATEGGGKRMRRVGDRLEWTDKSRGLKREHRLNVVASDLDTLYAFPHAMSSHPEAETRTLNFLKLQGSPDLNTFQTFSWWWSASSPDRNPLDLNYAYADGSVARLNKVKMFEVDMARFPLHNGGGTTFENSVGFWQQLPTSD